MQSYFLNLKRSQSYILSERSLKENLQMLHVPSFLIYTRIMKLLCNFKRKNLKLLMACESFHEEMQSHTNMQSPNYKNEHCCCLWYLILLVFLMAFWWSFCLRDFFGASARSDPYLVLPTRFQTCLYFQA